MKLITLTIAAIVLAGCASTPRTKYNDKNLRVMIDPDSVAAEHHVLIQRAMVEHGRFFVVDRAKGFKAIKSEQERTHRTEEDRYADKQKWAHWGKLYGVGGIVVASAQCRKEQGMIFGGWYQVCRQFLSILDSNSGEVIAAIENKAESDEVDFFPAWDGAVEKLNAAYPATFVPSQPSKQIEFYEELSAEEAQRQRERLPAGESQ